MPNIIPHQLNLSNRFVKHNRIFQFLTDVRINKKTREVSHGPIFTLHELIAQGTLSSER